MDFLKKDTTPFDILFIGSSRVEYTVNPRVIDSITGLNSVCVAMQGASIPQELAFLQLYLSRHKPPKLVILGLDFYSLSPSKLPYNYPEYYDYLDDSIFGSLNKLSITRFRYSFLFETFDRFLIMSKKTDYQKFTTAAYALKLPLKASKLNEEVSWYSEESFYKGYKDLGNSTLSPKAEKDLLKKENVICTDLGILLFKRFIEVSQNSKSKIVIVDPPIYYRHGEKFDSREFYSHIHNISTTYNIPMWDYKKDSLSYSKNYFIDVLHLNKAGATKFSTALANDISRFLK